VREWPDGRTTGRAIRESGRAGAAHGEFHLKKHKGNGCDLSPEAFAADTFAADSAPAGERGRSEGSGRTGAGWDRVSFIS